jgi:hypothetical protein
MNGEELAEVAMEPVEFARGVVDNALKSSSKPRFWFGARSSLICFLTTFFGHAFLVRFALLTQPFLLLIRC